MTAPIPRVARCAVCKARCVCLQDPPRCVACREVRRRQLAAAFGVPLVLARAPEREAPR